MNAAPTKPTTDIALEMRKESLLRRFRVAEQGKLQDGEEFARLSIACEAGATDATEHAENIHALVMATIATAAKKGLMITGGLPDLDEGLEFPVFIDKEGIDLNGKQLPRISVHRATMDDIAAIDAARESVSGVIEKTLRDIRNALVPAIKRNFQAKSELSFLYS